MLDYVTLKMIWWALLGILLIGFAVLDGFDFGSAMMLPFAGKTDKQRRIILNALGPVWESNQVWLILGGGAAFAAWPYVYTVSFSGLYYGIFLALFAIIIRPVAFKFRSKKEGTAWRAFWDWGLAIGGFVAPLIFGVAFGNLFLGLPFYFNEDMRLFYTGGFFDLLTPFPILCGLVAVQMSLLQGANYLIIKTDGDIRQRSYATAQWATISLIATFSLAGMWLSTGIPAYDILTPIDMGYFASPIDKEVIVTGNWLHNYSVFPAGLSLPLMGYVALILGFLSLNRGKKYLPFIFSSVAVTSIIATAGFSLFPYIIPSSINPNHSLTIWDSSSSQLTLFIMLLATSFFMPIILFYVSWMYKVMGGTITEKLLKDEKTNVY